MYNYLIVEKLQEVCTITLNRPIELNALNMEIREELKYCLHDISKDDSIGAVILCGAGKSFCAGGDIGNMGEIKPNEGRKRMKSTHKLLRQMVDMEKPVICAVQGYAVGAGLGLALASDYIIAAEDAKFRASFTKVGLVPDWGTFYSLPRMIGMARAKEMILMAPTVDSQEAIKMGLINRVVPNEKLLEEAVKVAKELASGPRIAIALCKSILSKSFEMSLEEILDYESLAQDLCMRTPDHHEGIRAFREKRKPNFNL